MTHWNPSEALARLAQRCGIAAEYHDIWGKPHPTSDQTRRALLTAMHFPVDADPSALLQELEDREWRSPLPPVMALRVGEVPSVPLTLPTTLAGRSRRWILSSESGDTLTGEFLPATLVRLDEKHVDGVNLLRGELRLPALNEPGYYRMEVDQLEGESLPQMAMTLIVAPPACYQPESVTGEGRVWGPSVQLYGVSSRRNWGMGDFGDLLTLVDLTADVGGGVVGVNPLHALFPDDPGRISPYSPSSRCFVNILYLDVEAVPEFSECEAARRLVGSDRFQARLRRLRAGDQVAYEEVAAAKREVLALLYRHFRDQHLTLDTGRARAFHVFCQAGGEALERHARCEALQEHFRRENSSVWGWPAWPEAYRHPAAPAVETFAADHAQAVEFFIWLQWLADEQLAVVGQRCRRRGLGVGLYQDMALGVNPGGSEAWAWQDVFATGAYAGAPPDDFALLGQDWGLPPLVPHRLRQAAYAPFIAVMRANMRHAGALRIDHVMALARVFWVPAGLSAVEGAYVAYSLEEMLAIVALESHRNRCMVIGEDLGTVPEGFRPRLAEAGLLSYRPFLFERTTDGSFKPPADYPRQALVAVSTHDLPTLRGFWQGKDLDTRAALQLLPSEEQRARLVLERSQDRGRMLMALEREGLLPEGLGIHPVSMPEATQPFVLAIHAYLARTKAQVLVVQPEDIFGVTEQANLPGSRDDQHANWRRRLPLSIEDWRDDGRFTDLGEALRRERGTVVMPP